MKIFNFMHCLILIPCLFVIVKKTQLRLCLMKDY